MRHALLLMGLMLPLGIFGQGLLAPVMTKRDAEAKSSDKNWSGAEIAWEKAAALNPTDPSAWLELGRTRYELKKYLEAIEPLQRAHDLGVSYAWDMPYFQACCYALGGKQQEALAKLQEAIDAGYRDLSQIPADDDLKSLHGLKRYHRLVDDEDLSKLGRNDGMIHDIHFYQRELKRLDYRERYYAATKLDEFANRFVRDVPRLSDNQTMVRFMEMGALMGDGHTKLLPEGGKIDGLPVVFGAFADGVFVVAAAPLHKELLGSKLLAIDGHGTDELMAQCSKLFGYENSQHILEEGPRYFRKPRCLNGLGLSPSDQHVTLKFLKGGIERDITLNADSADPDDTWGRYSQLLTGQRPLAFRHREKNFWYEYLPDSKTVYFQYNAVDNEKDRTIADFAKDLFGFVDSHDVDRMIIDARFNGGGNNFLNKPLVLGLIKSKINQPGKFFVITGKSTFSAAMCFVTQVQRYTRAIFAGEPTGSSPNFIGESISVVLRYTKMNGSISDLYWQNSVAMDHRKWISPEIYVPWTFASYAANQDPVMDAIMAYQK